jgi:hypothetical protein
MCVYIITAKRKICNSIFENKELSGKKIRVSTVAQHPKKLPMAVSFGEGRIFIFFI